MQKHGISKTFKYSLFALIAVLVFTSIGFVIIVLFALVFLIKIITSLFNQAPTPPKEVADLPLQENYLHTVKELATTGVQYAQTLHGQIEPLLTTALQYMQIFQSF